MHALGVLLEDCICFKDGLVSMIVLRLYGQYNQGTTIFNIDSHPRMESRMCHVLNSKSVSIFKPSLWIAAKNRASCYHAMFYRCTLFINGQVVLTRGVHKAITSKNQYVL
jgi:hypothetical protein